MPSSDPTIQARPKSNSKKPIHQLPLVFVDIETGGLQYLAGNPILQIAAIKVDPATLFPIGRYETYIQPVDGAKIDPAALEVNQINLDMLKTSGVAPKDALILFCDLIKGSVVAGHGAARFDVPFIQYECHQHGIKYRPADYHVIDTSDLAIALLYNGVIPSMRLQHVCEYFKIPYEGAHEARTDARLSFEVFQRLIPWSLRKPLIKRFGFFGWLKIMGQRYLGIGTSKTFTTIPPKKRTTDVAQPRT